MERRDENGLERMRRSTIPGNGGMTKPNFMSDNFKIHWTPTARIAIAPALRPTSYKDCDACGTSGNS